MSKRRHLSLLWSVVAAIAGACAADPGAAAAQADAAVDGAADASTGASKAVHAATSVVAFAPGAGAGFGQEAMPGIVLGAPKGGGAKAGSFDVVSLGQGGSVVLGFDARLVDGPGPDLIVFENAFVGWPETAFVAVSEDGQAWVEFPCDPKDKAGGFPGCAGVTPVLAAPDNGIDPSEPVAAGGDAFDLATIGVTSARFVRIRDSGANVYAPPSGGADLDAVVLLHVLAR